MSERRKITYISDFFTEDGVGGGEKNDFELLCLLAQSGYDVDRIRSVHVTEEFISSRKNHFFIVSNFTLLHPYYRDLIADLEYLIYEHDHKYVKTRNPADYDNYNVKKHDIINYHFYKNAQAVLCQSEMHKSIVEQNLNLDNIVNVSGNLWSLETLEKIRELSNLEKQKSCAILDSEHIHKNTRGTIKFCEMKNIDYNLIKDPDYYSFLSSLSKNKKFIFLPETPETLSRVVVEARMLGCSVLANNMIGAAGEDWFHKKGGELIDYMIDKRQEICNLVIDIISSSKNDSDTPIVSILTTFYEAEEYLPGFLENITNQSVFDSCELIIIDSASPGNERQIVESYCDKHKNIQYYRFEEKFSPTVGFNIALMKSSGKYYNWAMVDDRKSLTSIEDLLNELGLYKNIDLVYGDCLVTNIKNDNLETTSSKVVSEHSSFSFSKENMIKCLPGPMPLWSRRMMDTVGLFNQDDHDYSDDWEMWLRCVDIGFNFKKLDKIVGLYYDGGRSMQINNIKQKKEEAELFFRYKHIFGDNYNKFYDYFKNLRQS